MKLSGQYAIGLVSGALTGVAADAPVFSMRWGADGKALIKRFDWWYYLSTAFGTAQIVDHALHKATGFTSDDSGGAAITIADIPKKLSSHPTSGISSMRMCTTGALTPGVRTVGAQPIVRGAGWGGGVGQGFLPYYDQLRFGLKDTVPLTLKKGEGLILVNKTLMGATGVIRLYVNIEWEEWSE